MAKNAEYIQLENTDDVASVRDRLSFMRGQRVLLIWPEEGTILTRKLDLVLIQREAMRRAVRLSLVTHDLKIIEHAKELNISTFETIGASERGRWKRGRGKVFTNRFQRPKDEPIPDDLKEVASRIYAEETAAEKRWRIIRRVVGLAVFIVLAAAIAYIVLPSATIELTPAQRRIDALTDIIVDPAAIGIDIENRIIPSSPLSIQIDDSGTIETSGVQILEDATAAGSVVFVNRQDSPVTIPSGTVVTTSAGTPIQFRTTQEAELAGGAGLQVEVPIAALQVSSGNTGNVESGMINTVIGPLAENVTVRNINVTTGGATRSQKVVTEEDRLNLLAIVKQQLQTRAYVELQAKLTANQCIILDSIRIGEERDDWKTYSAEAGQVADTISLTMKAVVDAMVVDEQFAQQVVLAQLSKQMDAGQSIKPESVAYDLGCDSGNQFDPTTGRTTFQISGTAVVVAQVATEQIRQAVAGRSVSEAAALLATDVALQQGIAPQITVWPDGFTTLPLLPFRISVVLKDALQE